MKRLTPAQRKRLYDLARALIGVAVVYGLLSDQEAAAWALVLEPVLRMARNNVDE